MNTSELKSIINKTFNFLQFKSLNHQMNLDKFYIILIDLLDKFEIISEFYSNNEIKLYLMLSESLAYTFTLLTFMELCKLMIKKKK